jgi:hypothetical protein
LPHHKPFLKDANLVSALEYISMKGKSVGVLGSEWTMRLPLSSINFFSPREIEASKKDAVRAALMHDKDDNVGIPGVRHNPWHSPLTALCTLLLVTHERSFPVP